MGIISISIFHMHPTMSHWWLFPSSHPKLFLMTATMAECQLNAANYCRRPNHKQNFICVTKVTLRQLLHNFQQCIHFHNRYGPRFSHCICIISASLSIRIASRAPLMLLNIRPSLLSVCTCEQWQRGWLNLDAVWGGEWGRAWYGCIRF